MRLRRSTAAAAALLALAAAGCGRAGDRVAVREVAQRFYSALEAGDGAEACAQLSSDTRNKLESEEEQPCREAIASLRLEAGELGAVEVYITSATVELSTGDTAFLSETREGWRVTAAGCLPDEGDPAEVPLDCELEA